MIISLRNLSYEDLKKQLKKEDKIVIYSCNACIVACGVGGTDNLNKLEKALTDDGYQVVGKDLVSIGCTMNLVKKRLTDETKKKMYEEATVIIPLICEDGFEAIQDVFADKKTIPTTKTLGVGKFIPEGAVVLTTPFESSGLEKIDSGYTLDEAAEKTNLNVGAFDYNDENSSLQNEVELTINGQTIIALKGENLLKVCQKNGIEIPHLCQHDDLSDYGACRLCLVKIEGARDYVPSCCVIVEDKMVIDTDDEEIEKYRKMTLELLMASGEHNCLTCSKGVPTPFASCELQKMIRDYGITESRYENIYIKAEEDNSSEVIYYDSNKCILCGRCVRACEEVAGLSNLGFVNRGEETAVVAGLNNKISKSECVSCMACVNVCPTGALNEKVVHFSGSKWEPIRTLGI